MRSMVLQTYHPLDESEASAADICAELLHDHTSTSAKAALESGHVHPVAYFTISWAENFEPTAI